MRQHGVRKINLWVGVHCTLYPPPPHAIYLPFMDIVLREPVNCISEVLDTRYSTKLVVHSKLPPNRRKDSGSKVPTTKYILYS